MIEKFLAGTVRVLICMVSAILFIMSLTGTCIAYGVSEEVSFLPDSPAAVLAGAGLVLAVCLLLSMLAGALPVLRRFFGLRWLRPEERCYLAVLGFALFLAAGVIWMSVMPGIAGADSKLCFTAARELLMGEFAPWEPVAFSYRHKELAAGYAYSYPSQNGLILLMAVLVRLFGDYAVTAFRLMNLIMLWAGHRLLLAFLFPGRKNGMPLLLLLCFLPFTAYFLFAYGTVPGYGLSMAAMYLAGRFGKTESPRYLAGAAVCMTLAVLLKTNYIIVLAAVVIWLAAGSISQRRLRLLLAAVVMVLSLSLGNLAERSFLRLRTGYDIGGGIPYSAWVFMGLQEGKRAPGWYNGYVVSVFQKGGGDPDVTSEIVMEGLEKRIGELREDPGYVVEFFAAKLRSEWTDPTWQSLWIQEVGWKRAEMPGYARDLLLPEGTGHRRLLFCWNVLQTLLYGGLFLWSVMVPGRRDRDKRYREILPALVILGGFLFHVIWEAKGQYTVVYASMMVPLALRGYRETSAFIRKTCGTT